LAQDSLLRVLLAMETPAEPEKFGPWLCGIASRTCLDWLKRSERSEVSLAAADDGDGRFASTGGNAAADAERADDIDRLMREVERLPDSQREALMLYYYEDCTYQDLADRLGVSAATVNARLTQARQTLRERLKREDATREDVRRVRS
jgi:RNA polymerase sigma-70 factor (ECF subfamily)